jgi:fructose-specific phosphotransferase system component IIB
MVKLKKEVKGFIYDTCNGHVKKVFNDLTEQEIKTINKVLSEDDMLITESDDLNELFEFETEDRLKNDTESLNEVLEWCEQ